MKTKKNNIVLHIIACVAFLVLSLMLSPHPPHESIFAFSRPMQRDFFANVLILIFFYLNFYALIPKLYFQQKYLPYFLSIAAGFLIVCLLPSSITIPPLKPFPAGFKNPAGINVPDFSPNPYTSFLYAISHHIFLFLSVVLFSLLLKVRTRLFQAETAKQHAELSYLKAQINPHFLFNTLNSIYSLAIVKDDRTPEAVIQLSELMRYIIRDAGNSMVSLEKELNYINNYVALQTARLGDTVRINYEVNGATAGQQIAPLIITTYIENAFKHGVNPDEDSEIKIDISVEENHVHVLVKNTKVNSVNDEKGIGVKNTKERLDLLYPGKYRLTVTDTMESYTVALLITLV